MSRPPSEPSRPVGVLFLTKHMDFGGGEYVLRAIIEGLDRRHFRPVLACLKQEGAFGPALRRQGVPLYSGLLACKPDAGVLLRLRRLIAAESLQVVYLMDYRDTMLWGALAGRFAGVPTIMATHSTEWWGRRRSPSLIGKRLLRWHRKIVAVAAFQKSYLTRAEGVPAEMVDVIPNGVDATLYRPSEDKAPFRAALGLPPDEPVIGTVAVLRAEKNIPLLFAAVRRLLDGGRRFHVVIAGDGAARQALTAQCAFLGLAGSVRFLGHHDRPAEILPGFDAFTLTSVREVMPVTILEAMASGVPVVATGVGAVPELVDEAVTGYVIASGDVDALADRLGRLLDSPALRAGMGCEARRRVSSLFTQEAMVRRTEALLRATVAAP